MIKTKLNNNYLLNIQYFIYIYDTPIISILKLLYGHTKYVYKFVY